MSGLKRVLPVSLVGALSALAFIVPGASAAGTITGACTVNGTASTSEVALSGGGGTYAFGPVAGASPLTLACAGVSADDTVADSGVAVVNANSTGTYTNSVCGTGTATSTAGSSAATVVVGPTEGASDLQEAANGASYGITFTAGQGVITWGGTISGSGAISIGANFDEQPTWVGPVPPSTPGSALIADALGTGVNGAGTGGTPPAGRNDCTNHFTVNGAFTGTYASGTP
jgi:hypothetical protein